MYIALYPRPLLRFTAGFVKAGNPLPPHTRRLFTHCFHIISDDRMTKAKKNRVCMPDVILTSLKHDVFDCSQLPYGARGENLKTRY